MIRKVRLLVVMGAFIIFAGFSLVLFTIVKRVSNTEPKEPAISAEALDGFLRQSQVVSPGERVTSATTSGNLLTLVISSDKGPGRVLVLELKTLEPLRELDTTVKSAD